MGVFFVDFCVTYCFSKFTDYLYWHSSLITDDLLIKFHQLSLNFISQDNTDLQLLVRMIALGLGAWDMIDSQLFREPRLVRKTN